MVFSVQSQVVNGAEDLISAVLQAAQSVLRVAFVIVWKQSEALGVGARSSGGGSGRSCSRQDLAVELHSAIRLMFAMTGAYSK